MPSLSLLGFIIRTRLLQWLFAHNGETRHQRGSSLCVILALI
ncbi:hypothetical protein yaldo0001_19360 [Yersinia aldovae ATCC 35236]|nr:hypothetical protein yaldo0001_19360 [Yersinia aldovae ATCC 35236]